MIRKISVPVVENSEAALAEYNGLAVTANVEAVGVAGEPTNYLFEYYTATTSDQGPMLKTIELPFQTGLVTDVGVTGLSDEAMVAILIDRFTAKQSSPLQCDEWRETLIRLHQAQAWMQARTLARISRGVEGTNKP